MLNTQPRYFPKDIYITSSFLIFTTHAVNHATLNSFKHCHFYYIAIRENLTRGMFNPKD